MHIAAFTTALLLSMSFGFTVATCDYGAANNTILQNCLAATILAQGIALNIADQKNEQAALSTVKTLLTATPVDSVAFASAKANLLNFVNNGIAIRQMNQLITPPGNGAILGIAIVAKAQLTELGLSSNLTGTPTIDNPNVAALEADFAEGIEQNIKNMAAATAGCPASTTGVVMT